MGMKEEALHLEARTLEALSSPKTLLLGGAVHQLLKDQAAYMAKVGDAIDRLSQGRPANG